MSRQIHTYWTGQGSNSNLYDPKSFSGSTDPHYYSQSMQTAVTEIKNGSNPHAWLKLEVACAAMMHSDLTHRLPEILPIINQLYDDLGKASTDTDKIKLEKILTVVKKAGLFDYFNEKTWMGSDFANIDASLFS